MHRIRQNNRIGLDGRLPVAVLHLPGYCTASPDDSTRITLSSISYANDFLTRPLDYGRLLKSGHPASYINTKRICTQGTKDSVSQARQKLISANEAKQSALSLVALSNARSPSWQAYINLASGSYSQTVKH